MNAEQLKISMLKSVSVFADPDEEVLGRLANKLEELTLSEGETLFNKGDSGDAMYIIRQGRIKIHDGDHVFNVMEAGQIFGEYSLIDDQERSASATSVGSSRLYRLTKETFNAFADKHPTIKEGVLKLMIRRLRDWNVLEEELARKNVEIAKQRDEIAAQKEMKDKLFSIISHDLRGPISSFGGICGVIRMYIERERFDDLLEMTAEIDRAVAQLSGLLDNLLNYAAQELSQIPYNPEQVQVRQVVDSLFDTLELSAKAKKIKLVAEIDPDHTFWVDKNCMAIVIRNLISNALKFTPEDGSITVRSTVESGSIKIDVIDTGIGMGQEVQEGLFQMKAKSTFGTGGEKGVGLGLQLVAEFTKMNKGEVNVTSEVGKGSTFSIMLPATPQV